MRRPIEGGFGLDVAGLKGLGDDAFTYTQPADHPEDGEARVSSVLGGTVIEVPYTASPSNPTLRLAAAAAVAAAIVERLQ